MEEKIKNFDRSIEQIMNESSVAPPFGMWNRISAGLDSEALPVAASAPASVIPKRIVVGLAAAAVILGASLLTAYLVNTSSKEQKQTAQISAPYVTLIKESTPQIMPVTIQEATPDVVPATRKIVAQKIKAEQEEMKVTADLYSANKLEVAIPDMSLAENATTSSDPYYFPPVDVIVPETSKANQPVQETAPAKVTEPETKVIEKKSKPATYSSSEKRVKFKKKRSSGFTYGRLNRLKSGK